MTSTTTLIKHAKRRLLAIEGAPQPSNVSAVEKHGDRNYAVLRNVSGVIAVYRVRNDQALRPLKRWPAAIGS